MRSAQFLAEAKSTKEILKTANLIKNLKISAIITGEPGTGKSLLASYILPQAPIADGANSEDLSQVLGHYDELIIENFNKINNYEQLDFNDKKVIAVSGTQLSDKIIDKFFGIKIHLPPFKERPEDVGPIARLFLEEAKEILMLERDINLKKTEFDLSGNGHSLKKSIYFSLLLDNISENELLGLMENFLHDKLEGNNAYREWLYLYDRPLITAGLKKYGSQLKLSEVLGINRNTLRKKIYELDLETR